jgi:exodeoxyribonuclease VII small subunit
MTDLELDGLGALGAPAAPAGPAAAATAAPGVDDELRSYEDATARIEAIIRRLDSGEAGLRETLDLVREGRELVEYCATELDAVSRGLEELRLEELVTRLESSR